MSEDPPFTFNGERDKENFRTSARKSSSRKGSTMLGQIDTVNEGTGINATGSNQSRKKKGLLAKKIPSSLAVREYDSNEMSSKWDVKQKNSSADIFSGLPDSASPLHEDKRTNDVKKNFGTSGIAATSAVGPQNLVGAGFLSTTQGVSQGLPTGSKGQGKDEDFDEENTKKLITFYCHGREFQYCKESCQLFKKEHLIRRLSVWIVEWNLFKQMTVVVIIAMAVFMGLHDYVISEDKLFEKGGYQSTFIYTKLFFIFYFSLEIVLKVIAKGIYQAHNSYLRNLNNCIILTVFVIIAIYDSSFIFLLIFRIFYVFEFTNKFKYLKQSNLILKLYSVSAETLCKLFFLIFFFITLFGILSINIWTGTMDFRCRTTPAPINGDWPRDETQQRLCGGRYTCNKDTYCGSNYEYERTGVNYIDSMKMEDPVNLPQYNFGITTFDNIFRSYLSLFQIFMVEGFSNILSMMQDSSDSWIPAIFVVCYLLVSTYFLNDLIIAVFFTKYQAIEAEELRKKKRKQKLLEKQSKPKTFLGLKSAAISVVAEQEQKQKVRNVKKDFTDGPLEYYRQNSAEEKNYLNNLEQQKRTGNKTYVQKTSKVSFENASKYNKGQQGIYYDGISQMKMDSIRFDKESYLNKSQNIMSQSQRSGGSGAVLFSKKRQLTRVPFNRMKSCFNNEDFRNSGDWNETMKSSLEVFVSSKVFTVAINFLIFANMVILSFDSYPLLDSSQLSVLHLIHLLLIIVFLIEDVTRVFTSHNTTDFIVLALEAIVDVTSFVLVLKSEGLAAVSCLKGLRILYAFTNVKRWVNYRVLMDAINHSLPSVLNILLILFFFMYLGTIIGMWLFGGKLKFDPDRKIDLINGKSPRFHFDDLLSAFTSVFTSIQGDFWNNIWMDCVRCVGGWASHTYFLLLMILGKLIFLNSFISIMLNSFDFAKKKAEGATRGAKALIDQLSHMRLKRKTNKKDPSQPLTIKTSQVKASVHPLRPGISFSPETHSPVLQKKATQLLRNKTIKNSMGTNQQTQVASLKAGEEFRMQDILKLKSAENSAQSNVFYSAQIKIGAGENKGLRKQMMKKNTYQKAMTTAIGTIGDSKNKGIFQTSQKFDFFSRQQSTQQDKANYSDEEEESTDRSIILDCLKNSSLFLFPPNSKARRTVQRIITSSFWGKFFLVQIILSSVQLGIDNPLDDPDSVFQQVMDTFDLYFAVVFMLECIGQIIVNGLLFNNRTPEKAYLRSAWNILDIIINITSVMDIIGVGSSGSLKSLRSLRALRALRPLRVLSRNESLRLLVNALFKTVPLMSSLIFVTLMMSWIFSIFLMSFYKGEFKFCSMENIAFQAVSESYLKIKNAEMCVQAGGVWENQEFNFDNIFKSMLSFFKIILGESWASLMWSSVDSTDIEQQPIKDYSKATKMFFYFLVFIGNTYILNLFTGLIVINFKSIKDQISGYNFLTPLQRQWVEMQKFMMKRKLKVVVQSPDDYYRNICYEIQKSTLFEKIIIGCIIVNLIVMGCTHKELSSSGLSALDWINNTFLVIYHLEAIIKLFGIGFTFYFNDDWNKLDFAVIVITDLVLLLSLFIDVSAVSKLPIIFRALRLGRIMKYIRASHSLKVLIDSVYYLLPSLVNIAALLFLLVFICAVFGMNLFSDTMTLGSSLMIVFQCVQNQNWDFYMTLYGYDQDGCVSQSYEEQQQNGLLGCGSMISFPFFLGIVFFIRYIVINLFLALVIEGFIDTLHENEAVISPKALEEIIQKWSEYDQNATGFITPQDMYFLLIEIQEPIGLQSDSLTQLMKHYEQKESSKALMVNERKNKQIFIPKKRIFTDLVDFNVRLYPNQKTHFMDLCVKLSRNAIMRSAIAKNTEDPYFINQRIIIEDSLKDNLINMWETEFPNLKKYSKKNAKKVEKGQKEAGEFLILEFFAAKAIQEYFRIRQKEKKIKNQILENKLQTQMAKQDVSKSFLPLNDAQKSGVIANISTSQNAMQTLETNINDSIDEIIPEEKNQSTKKKPKFFQKVANQALKNDSAANFFFMKPEQSTNNKNQESLKQFQEKHNFSITRQQLGQKFPIKFATDFESLRPMEDAKKPISEEPQQFNSFAENVNQNSTPQNGGQMKGRNELGSPKASNRDQKTKYSKMQQVPPINLNINNQNHLSSMDMVQDSNSDDQTATAWRKFSKEEDANTDTAINHSINQSKRGVDLD